MISAVSAAAFSYRSDAAVPDFPDDRPIIVFDGQCGLCSRWVQFALRHDRNKQYRFLAAQSDLGAALYRHYGLHPTEYESNILIRDGLAFFEAEGSMRMIGGLGFPWSMINLARVLPAGWRDAFYRLIASNRYRWFGRTETCFLPSPEVHSRFLA